MFRPGTLTVAAAIVRIETAADARAVRADRTPLQSAERAIAPTAQRGTKHPAPAHNVTPTARLREEGMNSPPLVGPCAQTWDYWGAGAIAAGCRSRKDQGATVLSCFTGDNEIRRRYMAS